MSLESESSRATPYSGNGVTTSFSFPYAFHDATDLDVYLTDTTTGVPALQNFVSDYDVVGAFNPLTSENDDFSAGASVVFVSAPAAGKTVLIIRNVPDTQDTSLTQNAAYSSATIETALDKIVMMMQYVFDRTSRAMRAADGWVDPGTFSWTVPPLMFDDAILGINDDSTGFEWKTPADLAVAASASLTDHLADTSGAHAASAISVTPSGNLASTDAQAALVELQQTIDALSPTIPVAANKAVVSDGAGGLTTGTTTDTEIGYVHGVTSAIQTQIDAKEPAFTTLSVVKGGTNSATPLNNNRVMKSSGGSIVEAAGITGNKALASDVNGIPVATSTTDTELGYVHGVTSAIQTQIDAKEPAITTLSIAKGGTNAGTPLNNNRVMKSSGGSIVEAAGITGNKALASDANGIPVATATTDTELGYVAGVTSAIQTQINAKQATGNYITALTTDVTASGPGSVAATIAAGVVTNSKLANVSTATFKGRTTAGSGSPEDLTAAQATALLNAVVGDSGSGGTKGLVPAPASGDAAALKFLKADGTWAAAGSGSGFGAKNYATSSSTSGSDFEIDTGSWTSYTDQQVATMTIASPCVITVTSTTGFYVGMPLSFITSIALPTGITASTTYYVSSVVSSTTFKVATSRGGADVNTTGSQSGTHTYLPLVPVTVTAGALSNLAFARSTSSPLRSTASGLFTQTNASVVAGQGAYLAFTLDAADKAKPLSIQIDYNADSNFSAADGTTAPNSGGAGDSDIEVFIYDVTNSAVIPVSPQTITGKGSNNFTFKGVFQTASNSTSYRLVLHTSKTSAASTGYNFKIDNVFVGPQSVSYGPPVTDLTSFTPTGTWSTNTTYTGWWARRGDSLRAIIKLALAGAPTSASLTVNLPSGFTIDTTKLPATPTNQVIGTVTGQGAAHPFSGLVTYSSTTAVAINYTLDGSTASIMSYAAVTQAVPYTFANGDFIYIYLHDIPISGWSSTALMSNDTDTRVVSLAAHMTSNFAVTINTVIKFDTVDDDTHAAYSTSTGLYTCPVAGRYRVTANVNTTSVTGSIYVVKNGTSEGYLGTATSSTVGGGSRIIKCNAGDTLGVYTNTGFTAAGSSVPYLTNLSIDRLTGPSAIAATESVNMSYGLTSNVTPTVNTVVKYDTKIFDSHNAYSTSTGLFTCPVAGKYRVSIVMSCSGGVSNCYVVVSGSSKVYLTGISAAGAVMGGSQTVSCLAGDTIGVFNDTSRTFTGVAAPFVNAVSIERVGN